MERYYAVAIVTLLCSLVIFGMALTVARTHKTTGILAPAMAGHPALERAIRAHSNTLEWLPIFLPSMWLFALEFHLGGGARLALVDRSNRVFSRLPVGALEALSRIFHPGNRDVCAVVRSDGQNLVPVACLEPETEAGASCMDARRGSL
jgi:hypothetical protein